jgi:hypothetical protein
MRRERHNLRCVFALLFLSLLSQYGCSDLDDDVTDLKTLILVSPRIVEMYPGETATVAARLERRSGQLTEATWSTPANNPAFQSVTITPGVGSSVTVTITASSDAYFTRQDDFSISPARPIPVPLKAVPQASYLKEDNYSIFVNIKRTMVERLSQSVSYDSASLMFRGKCTFEIKNNASADSFQWQLVSYSGGIKNSNGSITPFSENAVISKPVIQGGTAEFTWTQKLAVAMPANGSASFLMRVSAAGQNGPALYCNCGPSAFVFYGRQ